MIKILVTLGPLKLKQFWSLHVASNNLSSIQFVDHSIQQYGALRRYIITNASHGYNLNYYFWKRHVFQPLVRLQDLNILQRYMHMYVLLLSVVFEELVYLVIINSDKTWLFLLFFFLIFIIMFVLLANIKWRFKLFRRMCDRWAQYLWWLSIKHKGLICLWKNKLRHKHINLDY